MQTFTTTNPLHMMKNPQRIEFANTLRGLAALAVLVSHYFDFFWNHRDLVARETNTAPLPEHYLAPFYVGWAAPGAGLDWGAYGVGLFFLISGFVIPFSLKRETWRGFAVRRLMRILPTYAVGFSLTLWMIWLGGQYFHKNWPYTFAQVAIHYFPGIRDVMMSPRIDGVIWTLELEMKFYVVCALLMTWLRRNSLKVFWVPAGLFVVAMFAGSMLENLGHYDVMLWRQAINAMFVAQYLIFLFIGIAFHYLYQGRLSASKAVGWVSLLFAFFCVTWWRSLYRVEFDAAINYLLALLTFAAAYALRERFHRHRVFDFLARISYPLYVIHCVSGMVALRILIDRSVPAWLALAIVTSAMLVLAWLLHRMVEAPTVALSKKWSTRMRAVS
jgi:peptidoglycan/LPS O-acetylase OafA/YrhL